ncbi:MAG: hypothetical protein ISS23_03795 [Nanoarchaeota archaeon]|nr:hypothetical protein [Nanoarchaeota archaeon]
MVKYKSEKLRKLSSGLLIGGLVLFLATPIVQSRIELKETRIIQDYKATKRMVRALNNPQYEGPRENLEKTVRDVETHLYTLVNTQEVNDYLEREGKSQKVYSGGILGAFSLGILGFGISVYNKKQPEKEEEQEESS